jgi:hypothetical protein
MTILRSVLVALPMAFATLAGAAQADTLSGTWSGSGSFQPKNGKSEAVRCKITYTPQGAAVAVSAACASASATIRQTGSLTKVSDTKYVGDFYNNEYDISGRVRVTVSGASQSVSFSSAKGSGSMSLRRR